MRKGLIAMGVAVSVVGVAAALYSRSHSTKDQGFKTVEVTRGPVVEKALAVGAIRPKREIAVKSKISGIVKRSFREVGDHVQRGRPALRDPARSHAAGADRGAARGRDRAERLRPGARSGHERTDALSTQGIVSSQESDQADKEIQDAQIRLNLATEKLALRREGARADER